MVSLGLESCVARVSPRCADRAYEIRSGGTLARARPDLSVNRAGIHGTLIADMCQFRRRRIAPCFLFLLACGGGAAIPAAASPGGSRAASTQPLAGEPLPGLTEEELERFLIGLERFTTVTQLEQGLGPLFNKPSCAACHSDPVGGWGPITVTLFSCGGKELDPCAELGGPLLQATAISAECSEYISREATLLTQRVTTSSLASGLIEAIPDAAILANADPLDVDDDGISGAARLVEPLEAPSTLRVGRFGWKAHLATVRSASALEARDQIGLTNVLVPAENAPNGDVALLEVCDSIDDPEDETDATGFDFVQRVTDFQRFLAPPPRTPRSGMTGEALFDAIGCAQCHVREWHTPDDPSLEGALRNRVIRPYTDFLLHDMGLLGDGFSDGTATGQEMRTPALWNLRARPSLLHDGRVALGSFSERLAGPGGAIWWHDVFGSEAQPSAAAFFALTVEERAAVVAFLDSLGRREFDADGDGDVDLQDFLDLKSCATRTGVTPDDACAVHDIDQDGLVNESDFDPFLMQYEGANGDCDGDGASDLAEVFAGAIDADDDGVPDNCATCPADVNADGTVDGADLGLLLASWSGSGPADLNADGIVDGADLGLVLAAWGLCG